MYGKITIVRKVVRTNNIRWYSKDSSKKLLEFLASMPKGNTERISEAQRQRQQISKKAEKYGPSTIYLQVIGSGARGAPNTLYLFTDQKRYLFNCGEGTQRLAHEHKVKLSRLDDIFITNKTWRNIGGLPGLSLTLQDVGVPNITLHGPDGLDELYNATKRFVIMKDMNVTMAKCSPSVDFEDNVMTVKYVLMGPQDNIFKTDSSPIAKRPKLDDVSLNNEFEEFIHDDTDYYTREAKNPEEHKSKRPKLNQKTPIKDPIKIKNEKVLNELQKQRHCTVAYICTLKKRLGTLVLEKCVEFGVKPGPMLGQLKSGQDVVLPDGTIVRSKDVKTPDDPGPVFIVLEVPDLSYLRESDFSAHFDNGTNPPESIPTIIVHFTPPDVFNHPTYRAFMSQFGGGTRHLVLNTQNSCLGSEAVHRSQQRLHLLDADMFPLLRDASIPALWSPGAREGPSPQGARLRGLEELKNKIAVAQFQNIINMEGSSGDTDLKSTDSAKLELITGRTLTMFHLRPKKELDRSAEPKLHIQEYIQEAMDVDGFVESLEHFRKQVENIRYGKNDSQKEYPKVIFLGTGSCIPSKTRNTSAIVLQINENSSMLLDCGEGTFGQLVRFFGPKRISAFLRTLKAIYVSHLHADHHIGLIGVLQARREALEEVIAEGPSIPLYLLAPGQIMSWLSMYDQRFERIRDDFTLIPNQNLLEDNPKEKRKGMEMTSAVLAGIGVQNIRACQVYHCPNAFGVAIDVDQQHKLTYSGDTIPCDKLVKIGENSTLLIHEATMEDELAEEARVKMHSTTSQAIDIGKQMNAKYTVLTHFSQRYARLPRLNAHILNDNNTVGIAFDHMQITMSDLELLPHMYAPLQLMFAEHCVELELKAAQRTRQRERKQNQKKEQTASGTLRNYSTNSHKQDVVGSDGTTDKTTTDKERNAKRKRSPSCCSRASAQYRDSHASRLRQERNRSLSEDRTYEYRSKSCSPTKNFTRSFMSKQSSSNGSAKQSPERSAETTPHTNPPSNIRDVKENLTNSSHRGHVVDTRSKTLNRVPSQSVSLDDYSKKKKTSTNQKKTIPCSSNLEMESKPGYGKPLVTPIHKKLTLRQEIKSKTSSGSEKSSSRVARSRTPTCWEENRQSSGAASVITDVYQQRASIKTVSGSRDKARESHTSANLRSDPRRVMKTLPATKSIKKPSMQQRTSSNSRRQSLYEKNAVVSTSIRQLSKSRLPIVQKRSSTKENIKENRAVINSTSSSRESLNGRTNNQSFCRGVKPLTSNGKNFGNHSSKSFKPQLEDIKSSNLLLNKETEENKVKCGLSPHSDKFGRVTDYWLDLKVKQMIKNEGPQSRFHVSYH